MYSIWSNKDYTTVAYLINQQGMKKILNKFFNLPTQIVLVENESNSDDKNIYFVADDIIYRNLSTYTVINPLIIQYNDLDIDLDIESIEHPESFPLKAK